MPIPSPSDPPLSTSELVASVADLLVKKGLKLSTAESCTGGGVAAACTDLAGSSDWFERGFITYSNAAKTELLGVDTALIATHGAVSEAVALRMAQGALAHAQDQTQAQVALAVTGVAGPSGGSAAKPVGTVWFAWCASGQAHAQCMHFTGDRAAVRRAAVHHALLGLHEFLGGA